MSYKVDSTTDESFKGGKLYTEADIFEIFEGIKKNIAMHKPESNNVSKHDCLLIIDVNFRLLK